MASAWYGLKALSAVCPPRLDGTVTREKKEDRAIRTFKEDGSVRRSYEEAGIVNLAMCCWILFVLYCYSP